MRRITIAMPMLLASGICSLALGAALTPGNLLLSYDFHNHSTGENSGVLQEVSTVGAAVQTFGVPYANTNDAFKFLRGLTVDPRGTVDIFNGTGAPVIS